MSIAPSVPEKSGILLMMTLRRVFIGYPSCASDFVIARSNCMKLKENQRENSE
jgi:hypothetical protein